MRRGTEKRVDVVKGRHQMSNDVLRHYWHPVATLDELGTQPVAATLLDERLVLYRVGERVAALKDLCIHRGTPLSLGWVENSNIVCGYHGWSYAPDGACVRIPSIPSDRPIPQKARVVAFNVQVRYGLVWVCLEEPYSAITDFPEIEDPSYHTYYYGTHEWTTSAARLIENFIDISHFPWVHPGLLGDRDAPVIPEYSVERRDGELYYGVDGTLPQERLEGSGERVAYRIVPPFAAQFIRILKDGSRYVMTLVAAPTSAKQLRRYVHVSRNFALDKPDEDFRRWTDTIRQQDQAIVESQRPEEVPLDLSAEMHIKGPDSVAVEYRRMLADMGLTTPYVA
jgi:phenylpropionate dioxygenase-like ring-hydroxylating dioxygenase large terminal subunit